MEYLAIKLGSTYTTIYKYGEGVVLHEPSLVACLGVGKNREIRALGEQAKMMHGRTNDDIQIFSPIFEGVISDNETASIMLKYFIDKIYPNKLIKPKIRAIISIPVGITIAEKKSFEKVCYQAHILDVTLVPSVICSALGLNLPLELAHGNMIVDIGGSSTNVAAIGLNAIVSGVSIGVGGDNIDVAIENFVKEKYNLIIGEGLAEKVKIEAGSLYYNDTLSSEISGMDIETKGSHDEIIRSSDILSTIEYFYDKIIDAVWSILNCCPPDIFNDIKQEGIYLLGGGALITGVENYFKSKLKMPVYIIEDSETKELEGAIMLIERPKLLKTILNNL